MIINKITTSIKDLDEIASNDANNFSASRKEYWKETKFTDKLLVLYDSLGDNFNEPCPRELITILQLYWICLRSFFISSQLILQGHIPEALALISRAAEAAGYASKMSKNPDKVKIWVEKERGQPKDFHDRFGQPFPRDDKLVYPEIYEIYDTSGEFGRHSNFASTVFFSDFKNLRDKDMIEFRYTDSEDGINFRRSINYVISSYKKILLVFKEIFEDFLDDKWLENLKEFGNEYDKHTQGLKSMFLK